MPVVVGPRRHLRGQDVLGADLAAVVQLRQLLGRQHRLQLGGRLAGLRAVGLVGDHGEALALAWPPARAPPPARTGTSGWCRRRSSCRRTAPRPARRSCCRSSPLMVATTPVVRSKSKSASCSCASITLRSETTSTVSNTFLFCASCRSARKCAVQAIEFVLPEPAECWIRYLPPGPSAQHGRLQLARRVELVEAGEDDLRRSASSRRAGRPGSGRGSPASSRAAQTCSHR